MKKLLLFCFVVFASCSKGQNNSGPEPQGNEFGSGGFGIKTERGLELFEIASSDMGLTDENYSDEKLYSEDWESEVREAIKSPTFENKKDFIHIFLNQLVVLDSAAKKRNPDSNFALRILAQIKTKNWKFNQTISNPNDVRISNWFKADSSEVVKQLIPLASRDDKTIRFSADFNRMTYASHQAALLYHELYGSAFDTLGRVPGRSLTQNTKEYISVFTRSYVHQSFLSKPNMLGITDLYL